MSIEQEDNLNDLELLALQEDRELELSLNAVTGADSLGSGEVSICGMRFAARLGEGLPLPEAIWAAEADASPGTFPVVARRYKWGEWIVSLKLADFQKLSAAFLRENAEGHCESSIKEQ